MIPSMGDDNAIFCVAAKDNICFTSAIPTHPKINLITTELFISILEAASQCLWRARVGWWMGRLSMLYAQQHAGWI